MLYSMSYQINVRQGRWESFNAEQFDVCMLPLKERENGYIPRTGVALIKILSNDQYSFFKACSIFIPVNLVKLPLIGDLPHGMKIL